MKTTVIAVLLLVFMAGAGFDLKNEQNTQKVTPEKIISLKQDKVTVITKEENAKTEFIDIEIKLPQIIDMQNKEAQAELNKQFTSIYELKNSLQKEASQAAIDAEQAGFPFRRYQLVSDYNISHNKHGILSLTETVYTYTGGAHGMTTKTTYNVDINSGKQISLKSIFKDDVNYKDLINREIARQISENPGNYFAGDMGFETIADNQNFYLKEGKIAIYFSAYEIAPYAAGIPEFDIRLDQLKDSLKP